MIQLKQREFPKEEIEEDLNAVYDVVRRRCSVDGALDAGRASMVLGVIMWTLADRLEKDGKGAAGATISALLNSARRFAGKFTLLN
jgi:hypothetical protein